MKPKKNCIGMMKMNFRKWTNILDARNANRSIGRGQLQEKHKSDLKIFLQVKIEVPLKNE